MSFPSSSARILTTSGSQNVGGNSATYTQHDYYDLPVHDHRSADIQLLARNQDLKIETRINKRSEQHDTSFNFEVVCWTDVLDEFVFFH